MLRNSNTPWWRRMFAAELVPVYINDSARRCPECSAAYGERDRYCPRCHTATPEYRYG